MSTSSYLIIVQSHNILIVDLGECLKFFSILILRDCTHHQIWLSSHLYISELLAEWNLLTARYPSTSFPYKFAVSDQPTALSDISDDKLLLKH